MSINIFIFCFWYRIHTIFIRSYLTIWNAYCICFNLFESSDCLKKKYRKKKATNKTNNNNNNSCDPKWNGLYHSYNQFFSKCAKWSLLSYRQFTKLYGAWVIFVLKIICSIRIYITTWVDNYRSNQTNTRRFNEKEKQNHYLKSSYVQRVISIGGLYLVELNEQFFLEKKKKKRNKQQQQPSVFSLLLLCHYLFSKCIYLFIFFCFKFRITLNSITL